MDEQIATENERLRRILTQVLRLVGSMLPERLDPVNGRLHEQALTVLRQALDD